MFITIDYAFKRLSDIRFYKNKSSGNDLCKLNYFTHSFIWQYI